MTSLLRQRWRTRQLVGDKRHVLIVRVRPGYMNRLYDASRRIDDGSTPFNGSPIFPPLIVGGHNHDPWQGEWVPTDDWRTVPNLVSAKWTRDFDVQTGGQKGTSTLTVVMDNIAFPEETGVAGVYHAIARGYYSPERGVHVDTRPNIWPQDTSNTWRNVLNGGYQVEVWEGYGQGAEVTLLNAINPVTNSFAPPNAAIARTWTGIVIDCDTEAHPDKITITARDFGIYLTDQRVLGNNKAPECRPPITFADRRITQGEQKIAGPYATSSGVVNEDGDWNSAAQPFPSDVQWIEVTLPAGYYTDFYLAPAYDEMEMYVSLYVNGGGIMDHTTPVGPGWVDVGAGFVPVEGIPYLRDIPTVAESPSRRWGLGYGFDVPDGSKLRLSFTNLSGQAVPGNTLYHAGTNVFIAYRYNTDPNADGSALETAGKAHWILVEDVSEVVRMVFIWAGFKEWSVEDFGWTLKLPKQFAEDKFLMDIITDMLQEGSFIFHMGAPTADDRSIGVPHFEHLTALDKPPRDMLEVRDTDMTEALQVKWDLSDLPYVIRYRGAFEKKGQTFGQDLLTRYMATYYPPWAGTKYMPLGPTSFRADLSLRRIAGILRHFTETMGNTFFAQLNSTDECLFACVLAAIQYCLKMVTAQFQIPGVPGIGLNRAVSVVDEASAVNSRMWVASVESDHEAGPNGKWKMTVGGSLVDTQEMLSLVDDYNVAWRKAQAQKAI